MNKGIVFSLMVAMAAFGFRQDSRSGSISGRVVPYNAAVNIWAVSDKDTAHGVIHNGEFELKKLKAGRYRVIAEGRRPYKVTTRPDVIVSDSANTNVGEIVLDQ